MVVLAAALGSCSSSSGSRAASGSGDTTASSAVATTGALSGTATIGQNLRLSEVANGLDQPVAMAARPMRNELWVAERSGRVRVISVLTKWDVDNGRTNRYGYRVLPGTVLDVSGQVSTAFDLGTKGIAFSTEGRTVYISFTTENRDLVVMAFDVIDPVPPTTTTTTTIASASPTTTIDPAVSTTSTTRSKTSTTLPGDTSQDANIPPPIVNGQSGRRILTVGHGSGAGNIGGSIMLGRDGYLYIGVGDGTAKGDGSEVAQDANALHGKILRIDPTSSEGEQKYVIPPDNPYVGGGGAAPVYVLGLQDPEHFAFDRATGDLWIADVDGDRFEEIDRLLANDRGTNGANLGWPFLLGKEKVRGDGTAPKAAAPLFGYTDTNGACGIVGGTVYRGSSMPKLQGVYLYGDRCTGEIRGLLVNKGVAADDRALGPKLPSDALTAFATDDQGEVYVLSTNGTISRLIAG